MPLLGENHHGKGRVRVTKVTRKGELHSVLQFTVEILLDGPMEVAFTAGDNSVIIPTDTQKNIVYVLAKTTSFECAEDFAIICGRHFVTTYPQLVKRSRIIVKEDTWTRIMAEGSSGGPERPHNHAFVKGGPHFMYGRCECTRDEHGLVKARVFGGVKSLTLFKTTQSSFTHFHKDNNTSLPEATDRLLGTCMDGEWSYDSAGRQSYLKARNEIVEILVKTFVGPADTGVPSQSVQETCFQMGTAVLAAVPIVSDVTLYMPNVHNLPFDLSKYGLTNVDHTGLPHIFYPVDEPHGIIQATIKRPAPKL